jgi:hypothetical protein
MADGNRAPPLDSRQRTFIVTAGRTGSSLLSAILADCGAEFGMPAAANWDRRSGEMEHPAICAAAACFKRAYDVAPARPALGWRRAVWNLQRSRGKRRLAAALPGTQYLKCLNLDLIVHPAFRLGYAPTVILSYRRFADHAISSAVRGRHSDLSLLTEDYKRVYRNGLLQMMVFGGCAVGYDQLMDRNDDSWALSLAMVTGIPAVRLIAARDRLVSVTAQDWDRRPDLDDGTREVFASIDAWRGRVAPPSIPYLRELHARHGNEVLI